MVVHPGNLTREGIDALSVFWSFDLFVFPGAVSKSALNARSNSAHDEELVTDTMRRRFEGWVVV